MNKTYCALPFRETMLIPNDVLLLCCRHDTNVIIEESIDKTLKTGKIEKIRQQMLAGELVEGCNQCYREEEVGIESMREQSIKRYGVVTDVKLTALHVQFDNICNLKCRMCTSSSSHLLYNEEIEIYGKSINGKKLSFTDKYLDINITDLEEVRLHGGEPFLSKRAEQFFNKLIESGHIDKINVLTPTNGMVTPTGIFLEALTRCNKLSIGVSIDAYGGLNDYFRGKSEFNTVISNLDLLYSLIDLRPAGTTNIGVVTTVNVYNVNKLKELDLFLKSRYVNLSLKKSFLNDPSHMRISCLPTEYKDQIRTSVLDYPEVLKMLDIDDTNYFEEFIFYHTQLDLIRQESLGNYNIELSNYISSYESTKEVTAEHIIKFHHFIDPALFND